MVSLGTIPLEEGARVDFERLRTDRRERVFALMDDLDLDVLVLGREPNARYATGARRLWVAGTRPFGPGCVLVRSTRETHMMSTWDEGIPPEVPREHLFGMSWNPMVLVGALQKIDGVASARRVGVDATSPLWLDLLPLAATQAEFVNAESALRSVRMRKTEDEILCIRTAVAVAEASLSAAVAALRPGIHERDLLGAFVERMSDFGLTTLAMEGIFGATEPHHDGQPLSLRRVSSDRAVDEGALVALCGGVMFAGYEGSLGRTYPCLGRGHRTATAVQRDLHARWSRVWQHLADACRPGNTGADLRAAYEASGEPLPPFPIAHSVGIGVEAPIAGTGLGAEFDARWQLEPGMVLQIGVYTAGAPGGVFGMETVLVHDDGHEVLSTLSHGPLAANG